jgi:CSLREA domain-containing protein
MFRTRQTRKLSSPFSDAIRRLRRRYRPTLEILEDRTLLSTYKVNALGDAGTGTGNSGDLRYCINQANSNSQANTIDFDSTVFAAHQTITLGGTQLELSNTAGTQTITGPAAGVTIDAAQRSRVLLVDTNVTASLSGLTLSGGFLNQIGAAGGGISSDGNLTLTDSTVTSNTSTQGDGGGIDSSGSLTLTNCTISNNTADGHDTGGGGIRGSVTMKDCTVSGNTGWNGGGLFGLGTILNSYIGKNNAAHRGGGVYSRGFSMTNCTVYYNEAFYTNAGSNTVVPGGGGGIYGSTFPYSTTLTNCTVVKNRATRLPNSGGVGGDIFNAGSNATGSKLTVNNCLIAASAQFGGDIAGVVSGHNNIIDDPSIPGYTPYSNLHLYNPHLNGAPTVSFMPEFDPALNIVSPLIGTGNPSLIPAGVTTDQRGASRISLDGTVDVGSVERSTPGRPNVVVVTTLTDEDNGAALPELGTGTSLREAINFANVDKGGNDVITFAPGLLPGTLDLTMGILPAPTATMTIAGPGAKKLTIDAMGAGGILSIPSGTTMFVSGVTLTGAGGQSAVSNSGTLTMNACAVVGNQATNGGGINNTGTLTLSNSTFSANKAFTAGGAVYDLGPLTMTNCTLSGNTAPVGGGVISYRRATPTITNCTIVGNDGGISAANVTLNNTIVAQSGSGGDIDGVVSGSNNLVDDPATAGVGAGRLQNGVNGNIVGLDPMLGPLAYNGGPTQTMVPLAGSPAIEGGDSALVPAGVVSDQRGTLRIKSSAVCIGSVEVGPLVILVTSLADTDHRGTLRHAIEGAENIDPTDPVTIKFAPDLGDTITLTNGALPAITGNITIFGPGANVMTIDGNMQSNILSVQSGGSATLIGLTLAHGQAPAPGSAGGIVNSGSLNIRDCTIDSNNGVGAGGGIANFGTLKMADCTVSNNGSFGSGGGLSNNGTATLYNCTLYKNLASVNGGGVYNAGTGTLRLDDCTVAANFTALGGMGGGIDNASTTAMTLNNSIIANSAAGGDVAGPVVANSTLIGDLVPSSPVDPKLGPLGYYGGPTKTMQLLATSPAINAGNPALFPQGGIVIDQRGAPRINASGGLDQGAFQSGRLKIFVTTLADVDNGSIDLFNAVGISLREAINFANADPSGGDTIKFSPLLSHTLTLTAGALPTITAAMTIEGPGADMLTIDAHGQSRILALSASANVTISGLTLANGSATVGAGIENLGGTLNLVACTISGSKATSAGGIYNKGTLTLTDSTLSANQAINYGGAVYSRGSLTLTDCTVYGNTAAQGGGIFSSGTLNLASCTVADNSASTGAGVDGNVTMNNTIVADSSSGGDIVGSITGSNNLIDNANPKLGPLAWNGGPTQTVALLPGSPAIGSGRALSVTKDQRGLPLDAPLADIGAFQYQGPPHTVKISGPTTGTVQINESFTFTVTDPTPADQHFMYTIDWNGDRSDVETISGPATLTVPHGYVAAGTYTPSVIVLDQEMRSSAPAFLSSVQVSAVTVQDVTNAIVTVTTVQLTATTPTNFSTALALLDQVPPDSWGTNNVADIKLQGGAASQGVVVQPSSPNATIDVSATENAKQNFQNLSLISLFDSNNPTNNELEIGSFLVAGALVGGITASGAVSEFVELADFAVESPFTDVGSQAAYYDWGAFEAAQNAADNNFILTNATAGAGSALGAGQTAVGYFQLGGSPALTVKQGKISWSDALMATNSDASTVLVTGGRLDLMGNVVAGNVNGSRPLIEVDGGTLILGSADGTHGNVLGTYKDAAFIHVALDGEVIVEPGNFFAQLSDTTGQAAGATTIQLASSAPVATPGQAVTFTATVTALGAPATDGSVEFFDYTTGAFLGMVPVNNGSASVQATLNNPTSGDTIYATYLPTTGALAPTSDKVTQEVLVPTTATLASSANPSVFGQTVTFTATVSPTSGSGTPTGTVTFLDGGVSIGSGTLSGGSTTFTTSGLAVGSHTITVNYSGDSNFSASTSAAITQTVNQASTTTTVSSSMNPSAFGQAVTFTATVSANAPGSDIPTGMVTFLDGAATLGSTSLAGGIATLTTSTLELGNHPITASYSGDANFNASTSGAITQTVNQAPTTTTLAYSANPSVFGQTVTFTATVAPSGSGTPTGAVTFSDSGTSIGSGTLSGGIATFSTSSLTVGMHTITATYSGDTDFTASTSAAIVEMVTLPSRSAYILNATASGALSASGNASAQFPGGLSVDSNSASAITATGSAQVNVGGSVLVMGGVSVSGNAAVTKTGTPLTTVDPLGTLPLPGLTGLTNYGAVSVAGQTLLTLSSGIYSSIQISGRASVTLNPGWYIILGGGLSVAGNGSLSGSGVIIFNAGSSYNGTSDGGTFGSISIGGNGTINLSAPTSGPYAGVAIFQSRANSRAMAISGGNTAITGTIYAAGANAGLSGNAQVTGSLVVSTLTLSGNAGAFQLANGSSSSYAASTCNWITNGILTIAAEDDTGSGLDTNELARLSDAMTYLNGALASFGVNLGWAAAGTPADVTVHFASATPHGGAADGVLGFTTATNDVYFVTGWNYYTGPDATQVAANQYDFLTLAVHELAHTVGLGESVDPNSVMYEYLAAGTARRTLTDSNLALINTNSDRFMKVAGAVAGNVPETSGVPAGISLGEQTLPRLIGADSGVRTDPGVPLSQISAALSLALADQARQCSAINGLAAIRVLTNGTSDANKAADWFWAGHSGDPLKGDAAEALFFGMR